MKRQSIPQMLWIGVLGCFIFGSNLASGLIEAFYGDADIWWTPQQMMLPLDETKNNFEIRVSGQSLAAMIDKGWLFAEDGQGNQYRVSPKDLGVRLNNWPARQASILKFSIIHAFFSGISLTLTGLGIWQVLQRWKNS